MLAKCLKRHHKNTRSSRVSGVCQTWCTSGAGSPVTSLLSSPRFLWIVPTRHFPRRTQTLHRSPYERQNKQQTGRHAADDTFIKQRRNWGICYLSLQPLRILCCSAGVTAIGGSKSRSSLCFGCSALVFDPVVSQHGGFSTFLPLHSHSQPQTGKSSHASNLSGSSNRISLFPSHWDFLLNIQMKNIRRAVHHWSTVLEQVALWLL